MKKGWLCNRSYLCFLIISLNREPYVLTAATTCTRQRAHAHRRRAGAVRRQSQCTYGLPCISGVYSRIWKVIAVGPICSKTHRNRIVCTIVRDTTVCALRAGSRMRSLDLFFVGDSRDEANNERGDIVHVITRSRSCMFHYRRRFGD